MNATIRKSERSEVVVFAVGDQHSDGAPRVHQEAADVEIQIVHEAALTQPCAGHAVTLNRLTPERSAKDERLHCKIRVSDRRQELNVYCLGDRTVRFCFFGQPQGKKCYIGRIPLGAGEILFRQLFRQSVTYFQEPSHGLPTPQGALQALRNSSSAKLIICEWQDQI